MENKVAVVIPTYNERENIRALLVHLLKLYPGLRIFVVDDNSPDGTAELVQDIAKNYDSVRLIWRDQKLGLASAYLDAFARIIPDPELEYIVTMDADFSHHPGDLGELLRHALSHDVVVGSRYVGGGAVENWNFWRKFLSKWANMYAELITGVPVADLTAGFVVYRRDILGQILTRFEKSEGYAYQIEMKYLAHKLGAKIKEVPITFRERNSGKSKFTGTVIWEGVFIPWYLRFFK
ncbi:MAG: polyprenol monophosphomannose synthase [Candidatus Doudnabacteria bacterium]|nr:polyprenol monophosphomannose synthase [Candidatus Doudnabacteria bacterium]